MTVAEYKDEFTKLFKSLRKGFNEDDLNDYLKKLDFEEMLKTDMQLYGEPRVSAAASDYALMYPDY